MVGVLGVFNIGIRGLWKIGYHRGIVWGLRYWGLVLGTAYEVWDSGFPWLYTVPDLRCRVYLDPDEPTFLGFLIKES